MHSVLKCSVEPRSRSLRIPRIQRSTLLGQLSVILLVSTSGLQLAAQELSIKRLDGSTISPAEVDSTVSRLMQAAEVTGVGIAIFNDGKIAYLKTYGVRDKEKNLPITPDSVMTAASLSKAAFVTMVMELVEKGILDLDKPVYQYLPKPLPEYPFYRDLAGKPRYKQITLRMCLDHTTGFPNRRAFNEDRKLNINFQPGSRYAYSGEGILLAQLAVETVTKKPVNDLMGEYIFAPDNMTRTSMVGKSASRVTSPTATTSMAARSALNAAKPAMPRVPCRQPCTTTPISCKRFCRAATPM